MPPAWNTRRTTGVSSTLIGTIAVGLVHAGACAPPCEGAADIVDVGDVESFAGAAPIVASADVTDGRMIIGVQDAVDPVSTFTMSFSVVDGAPPTLPPAGAVVRIGSANCFGESCEPSWFAVDGFFEIGEVALINDDEDTLRPRDARIGVVSPVDAPDLCDDGDAGTDPAAATIDSDDGVVVLAPGETTLVSIVGQDWQTLGGRAARRSSFHVFGAVGGPGPGFSSRTAATAVLYQMAPPR